MDLILIVLIILLVVGVPTGWRCGGPPWGGGIAGLLLLILLLYLLLGHARAAEAHEWFTGKADPASHQICCGGTDCKEIPVEWVADGAIRPTATGYHVHLTPERARAINMIESNAIDEDIPYTRTEPSEGKGASGFALCLVGGKVRCFFAPLGY